MVRNRRANFKATQGYHSGFPSYVAGVEWVRGNFSVCEPARGGISPFRVEDRPMTQVFEAHHKKNN